MVWLEDLQGDIPNVSSSTLRRDIKELERLGKVERLQGGAIKASSPTGELLVSVKNTMHAEEKMAIARIANVVTTNTDVLALVAPDSPLKVTVLGGSYDPAIGSISGPLTQENIDRHVFLKAFLGANGIDARFGITTPSLAEAAKKQAVAARSKYVYVLADSSKFHQVTAIQTLDLADVTVVSERGDDELATLTNLICE